MKNFWIELLIILSGLAGFCIAFYISHKKHKPEPMICPMHSDCKNVITSHYSKFAGIPVEKLGLIYYAFIILSHALFIFTSIFSPDIALFFVALALCAFLFSLYLVAVQAFVIGEWCTWCLFSALVSAIIFVLSVISFKADIVHEIVENGLSTPFKSFSALYVVLLLVLIFAHTYFKKKLAEKNPETNHSHIN